MTTKDANCHQTIKHWCLLVGPSNDPQWEHGHARWGSLNKLLRGRGCSRCWPCQVTAGLWQPFLVPSKSTSLRPLVLWPTSFPNEVFSFWHGSSVENSETHYSGLWIHAKLNEVWQEKKRMVGIVGSSHVTSETLGMRRAHSPRVPVSTLQCC